MKKQISEKHLRQNKILADPVLRQIEEIILNIHNRTIPEQIYIKKGVLVIEYPKAMQDILKKAEVARDAYIELNYPGVKSDDT
jgi:hypothetical protein